MYTVLPVGTVTFASMCLRSGIAFAVLTVAVMALLVGLFTSIVTESLVHSAAKARLRFGSLAVIMFFGGWLPPFPNLLSAVWATVPFAWIPPVVWYLCKVLTFMFVYIWFRGTFPRYRFDQLMEVGWKWLLPLSLANVMLVGLGVLLLKG